MSNKTQLQLNNETLASILSNVLGLPSQESLKHGAYVWKKYTTTPIYVENSSKFYQKVVITEPQNAAITYEFSTTYTFDENTGLFTLGSGGGISVPYDSSGEISVSSKYYMIGTRTGITMYQNDGASVSPTLYNNAGGVTILAYNDSHLVTEYQSVLIYEKSDFIDFVVSDSSTAYPDGGEQGGYWYERVKDSIEYGEFTPSSTIQSVTIQTNLKSISKILIRAKSTIPSQVNYHGLMVLDKHKEPINLAGNLFYTVGLTCLGTTLYAIRDTVADELDVSSGEITITPPAAYNAGTTYFLGGVTYEYALLK